MDAARCLRPRFRVALAMAGCFVGGVWALFAAFTAYAAVWWPEHGILENTATSWLVGTTALSSIFVLLFACDWVWVRHLSWRVGSQGIAVYRLARLQRSFDWSDITTLQVMTYSAGIRSGSYPLGEEIRYLAAEDSLWLQKVAADRFGQPPVA